MGTIRFQIPEGEGLVAYLRDLARRTGVSAGEARLSGALQHADLRAGPGAAPVALDGPLYLVNGSCAIGGDALVYGVISWSDRGQPRMAAGVLEEAISQSVTVTLESLGETGPAPQSKARPKKARPKKAPKSDQIDLSPEIAELSPAAPAPAPAPAPTPPATGGWAAAVAASKVREPLTELMEETGAPELRAGDVLIHPRFGRCRVARSPGGSEKVKVRRATGGLIDLHMRVCRFTRQADEDGRRVFRIRIGK